MRTVRILLALACVALLLFAGPSTSADADDAADAEAKALYATYRAELKEKTWGAFLRRLDALRALGPLQSERARESLLRVAKSGKSLDDRIVATLGLASHAPLEDVKALLDVLSKKGHPVLTEVAAEGLGANAGEGVRTWLAGEALGLDGIALEVVVRAIATKPLPAACPTLAAKVPAWAANARTVELAFDAVQAIGRAKNVDAKATVLAAAVHADPRLRLAAADVLASQPADDEEIRTAVRRLLGDDQTVVRRSMVVAIGAAKAETYVPDVAARLGDDDLRTRKETLDALKAISGKDFGFDAGAWTRWWKDRDLPDAPEPHTVPTYHGLHVYSERVLFILDRSGSMNWPHAPGVVTRMEVAHEALVDVLGQLSKSTRFNVLAFDSKVDPWRKGETEADPKTVAKAAKWVRRQSAEKGAYTNTYGALERAFEENPETDTIFLLSDGIPEDGDVTTSEGLLAALRVWNRYRRVKIHAIALTLQSLHPGKYPITASMRRAATFMQTLARAGGGEYTLVNRPPKPN